MGVVQPLFDVIDHFLTQNKPKRAISLGYPDLLVPPIPGIKIADSSAEIGKYHGITGSFMDSIDYFASHGCDLDVLDYAKLRGPEIVADLNQPLTLQDKYSLVLDPGTIEHCFNISQCLSNILALVADGGHIIHWNPANMCNHGFYNFSPTFYRDFYEDNDGIIHAQWFCGQYKDNKWGAIPIEHPYQRYPLSHPNMSIMTLAYVAPRTTSEVKWPIQYKYRKMLNV